MKIKNIIKKINSKFSNSNFNKNISKTVDLIYCDIIPMRRSKNHIAIRKINSIEELLILFDNDTRAKILIDLRTLKHSIKFIGRIVFDMSIYRVQNLILNDKLYLTKEIKD